MVIRKLKVKDQIRLTGMFFRLASHLKSDELRKLISSARSTSTTETSEEDSNAKLIEVSVGIIGQLINTFHDEMFAWFADLIGVTVDEFYEMPIDTTTDIIEQLRNAPEAVNFFTTASRVFSSTLKSSGIAGSLKTS